MTYTGIRYFFVVKGIILQKYSDTKDVNAISRIGRGQG